MLKDLLSKYSAYIIAYISIAGYYLAYKYKEGYYSYFNIPSVYINDIDFIDIITMVTTIIGFLSTGLYIILTHRTRDMDKEETVFSRINRILLPFTILCLAAGYFDFGIIRSLSLIIILLIIIYNFVLPLIFCYRVKGYNNKIADFFKSENAMDFMAIIEFKVKYQSMSLVIAIIFLTYALGIFVSLFGLQNAKSEEQFNVTEINEVKHIVFNIDSEKVIASTIIDNKLSDGFSVYLKSDITIKKEDIKDLKVD